MMTKGLSGSLEFTSEQKPLPPLPQHTMLANPSPKTSGPYCTQNTAKPNLDCVNTAFRISASSSALFACALHAEDSSTCSRQSGECPISIGHIGVGKTHRHARSTLADSSGHSRRRHRDLALLLQGRQVRNTPTAAVPSTNSSQHG